MTKGIELDLFSVDLVSEVGFGKDIPSRLRSYARDYGHLDYELESTLIASADLIEAYRNGDIGVEDIGDAMVYMDKVDLLIVQDYLKESLDDFKTEDEKEEDEKQDTLVAMLHHWYSLTVSELKEEARRKGLKVGGTKQDLIYRLQEHHKKLNG